MANRGKVIMQMIEKEVEEALKIEDKRQRYEHVYDALCDYLDKQFRENNYCEFQDDKCVAIREGIVDRFTQEAGKKTGKHNVGCCHSYNLGLGLGIKDIKPCKHLGDKQCNTKCISCKLYSCKYLRNKGVKFSIYNFPELKKIFNNNQIEVLECNPFNLREDIIDRLVKVSRSRMPNFLFWLLNKASID